MPFDRRYVPWLHRWESDVTSLYLWTAQREVYSLEDYEQLLLSRFRGFYHSYFVVTDLQGTPQGFVYSYEANLFDGFAFIAQYLEPQARGQGRGVEILLLFLNFLFAYFGSLRKLYCDVYEYNVETLSMLKRGGFEVEGCFRRHRFYGGRYYDMFRLTLYREMFAQTIAPRLEQALRQLE
jgi:RimJ/RimL family protein N-acetyltransferase